MPEMSEELKKAMEEASIAHAEYEMKFMSWIEASKKEDVNKGLKPREPKNPHYIVQMRQASVSHNCSKRSGNCQTDFLHRNLTFYTRRTFYTKLIGANTRLYIKKDPERW